MFRALRHPHFKRLFFAALVNESGNKIHRIALMVLVYTLTESAGTVALIMSAELVVSAVFAPVLTAWADTLERRRVLVGVQLGQAALVIWIPIIGERSLLLLWLLVFAVQVLQSVERPLIAAATPELVPESSLDHANGLISFAERFSEVAFVGLAGLLVAAVGPEPAFYIDAVTFVTSATLLSGLPSLRPPQTDSNGYWGRVVEGYRYLLSVVPLRRTTLALASAALFGSVENVLGVVLALGVLKVGSAGYGVIEMAMAAGAVAGALLIASLLDRYRRGRVFLISMLVFGFFIASVGAWPIFWWVMVAYFLSGLLNMGFLIPARGILQTHTPPELRARIFGAVGSAAQTAVLVGVVFGGAIADVIGVTTTYLLAGIWVSLVALAMSLTGGLEPAAESSELS